MIPAISSVAISDYYYGTVITSNVYSTPIQVCHTATATTVGPKSWNGATAAACVVAKICRNPLWGEELEAAATRRHKARSSWNRYARPCRFRFRLRGSSNVPHHYHQPQARSDIFHAAVPQNTRASSIKPTSPDNPR